MLVQVGVSMDFEMIGMVAAVDRLASIENELHPLTREVVFDRLTEYCRLAQVTFHEPVLNSREEKLWL